MTQASSSLLIAATRWSGGQASLARSTNKLASSLPPPFVERAVWKGGSRWGGGAEAALTQAVTRCGSGTIKTKRNNTESINL